MKEEWLLAGAAVPVTCETVTALVAEIKRLIDVVGGMALAQQEPVLQDIEQYRLQMAAICTAAIGCWEEDDGIRPDYDTLAFRDVAKLYAKYDALYRAQPEQEPPQYSCKAHWTDDKRIGVVACVTRPDGGVHLMQTIIDLPPEQAT